MTDHTPTTQMVKRVYVLAPDDLARDGRKDWSMVADDQFDRWYQAARDDARANALRDFATELEGYTIDFSTPWNTIKHITSLLRRNADLIAIPAVVGSTPEGQTP